MNLLTPLAQEGPGDPSGDLQTQTLPEPLIDAPNPVEWLGFGVGAVIFLIIILFMIRARVIGPARRRAAAQQAVFEPAGEDAEITFDDDAPLSRHDNDEHERNERNAFDRADSAHQPEDSREAGEQEQKKSRSPFAGLFSQKRDHKEEPVQVGLGEPDDYDSISEIAVEPAPDPDEHQRDKNAVATPPIAEKLRNLDDDVELRRRQAEKDEHEHLKMEAQLRAEQSKKLQEERDRAYHSAREDALRETEFERRKNEAALEQRLRSLTTVERKLSEKADALGADAQFVEKRISESLEERFAALSQELNQRLEEAATYKDDQPPPSVADMADYVGLELANLRRSMQDAIARLGKRIDESIASPHAIASLSAQVSDISRRMDANIAAGTSSSSPSLYDLIRQVAPPERTAFNTYLSNGKHVDCLVSLAEGEPPVPISNQYPAEAFAHYLRDQSESGGESPAANTYRRAVLRQIVDVAEHMIIAGETASSAILFAPTDAIVNDLYEHFPDLIEDSYHASVWIVSATSLGATLGVMTAAKEHSRDNASSPKQHDADNDALLAEIDMLREQVAKHEDDIAESPHSSLEPDALASAAIESEEDTGAPDDELTPDHDDTPTSNGHSSMSPEEAAFERLERLEREEAITEAQEQEDSTQPSKERPPFPLR